MLLQNFLQQLFSSLWELVLAIFNPIILIPAIIFVIVLIKKNKDYKKSAYYTITKLPYSSVKRDIGRYGEYLTYKYLKKFENKGSKFLFNVYLPKENGETSEIDVLMISPKGIFVFESKNYSGWIFGSENQKNWYQTLPKGKGRSHKEHFYNPIMQNRSHIKYLKMFLGEQIPMRSIIVFSDRCTLKNVKISSNDISVINRYNVESVVCGICNQTPEDVLTENDITEIYNKLYPCTQVDESVKAKHIENIHSNLSPESAEKDDKTVTQDITYSEVKIVTEPKETTVADAIEICKTDETTAEESTEPKTSNAIEGDTLKCPKCNADLVLRTATKGANAGKQFYGCSNYPKCKYIKNI